MKMIILGVIIILTSPFIICSFIINLCWSSCVVGWNYCNDFKDWIETHKIK